MAPLAARWRVAIGFMAVMSVCGRPAVAAPSKPAGPCFQVRGRLAIWNGAPAVRIWPVGTRRMLGVHTPEGEGYGDDLMPVAVRAMVETAPEHTVVYGNYRVCPLTAERPGRMRIVYIARAWRLSAGQR
jgi:hypothetical protein